MAIKRHKDLQREFHKSLTSFSVLMLGVGGLIGGGIFSVLGVITEITGPYSYISYFFMGFVALLTAYSYEKLTMEWGVTCGGTYDIVQDAFVSINQPKKKVLGAYTGLILYFGYIGTLSLYAYTFSVYLLHIFDIDFSNLYSFLIIFCLLFVFMVLNLRSVKETAWVENVMVILKISILLFFIIFGMVYIFKEDTINFSQNLGLSGGSGYDFNFGAIIIGSSAIIVSYEGYELIANTCEEMKNREKGVKMMRVSVIIAMIIYILTAMVSLAIMGVEGIVGDGTEHAEVAIAHSASYFMGNNGMLIISFGALLSTSSALNATLLGTSRLGYEMANDRYFPRTLAHLSNKHHVPNRTIILTSFLTLIIAVSTGGALAIAGLTDLIFAQVFFIANYTNFKAYRESRSKRIWPLIGCIFTAGLFFVLFYYFLTTLDEHLWALIIFGIIELLTVIFLSTQKRRKNQIANKK